MEVKLDPKKTCTIYLVRHGETDNNVNDIIQGQMKGISLNTTGKDQAKLAALKLKKIKFDAIYSSDLLRAKQTAQIINLEHNLAIKTHKALRERHFGKFEGYQGKKFRNEIKDLLEEFSQLSDQKKIKFQFPHGIESIESMISRFITYTREIAIAHPKETILITSHGGVIRWFLIQLGFATEKQLPWGSIDNTAQVIFKSNGVDFVIEDTIGVNKKNEN